MAAEVYEVLRRFGRDKIDRAGYIPDPKPGEGIEEAKKNEIVFLGLTSPHRTAIRVNSSGTPEIITWSAENLLQIRNAWNGSLQGSKIDVYTLPERNDQLLVPKTNILVVRP